MSAIISIRSLAIVLEYDAKNGFWDSHYVDLLAKDLVLPPICYIFLESGDWYKEHCPESDRLKILAPFHAPDFLANSMCTDLNGFFGSQSSFSSRGGNSETLSGLNTWFRMLTKKILKPDEALTDNGKSYLWYEMGFFTHWRASSSESRILCIGAPPDTTARMKSLMMGSETASLELRDPFALLRPLLDEVVRLYDDSVWRVTKLVRGIELNRTSISNFEALRDLGRHTGHIMEVEQVAIETMDRILAQQESNFKDLSEGLSKTYQIRAREYLAFQLQLMRSLRWRTNSTIDRLGEEQTLAYNRLASSDNNIMKSITILTMIFLPATFISALFSTTFFSFEPDGWQFSSKFWIYWAFTIPLTILVFIAWWFWLGGHNKSIRWRL